jgi:hypothetical protein
VTDASRPAAHLLHRQHPVRHCPVSSWPT